MEIGWRQLLVIPKQHKQPMAEPERIIEILACSAVNKFLKCEDRMSRS